MNLERIRLVGTEADESVTIISGGFLALRFVLWNGLTEIQEIALGTDFIRFPVVVFEDLRGVKITHVSFSGRRGSPTVKHIGFMEFTDIGGAVRKAQIPLGEIIGKTFGVFLLTSIQLPASIPMPQFLAESLFTVSPIVIPS